MNSFLMKFQWKSTCVRPDGHEILMRMALKFSKFIFRRNYFSCRFVLASQDLLLHAQSTLDSQNFGT